jgi:hypothetical protein
MRRAGAVDGNQSTVEITVQGKTDKTVVLTGMRALVDKHSQPAGNFEIAGCGGLQPVRLFTADPDQPPSAAVPQAGHDNSGAPTPAEDFPFRMSPSDPEVFNFVVSTQACDCAWRIELSWTVDG